MATCGRRLAVVVVPFLFVCFYCPGAGLRRQLKKENLVGDVMVAAKTKLFCSPQNFDRIHLRGPIQKAEDTMHLN